MIKNATKEKMMQRGETITTIPTEEALKLVEEHSDINTMTREEIMAALETEKTKNKKELVVKVSTKGAVQINGIRRFPITFYKDEWDTIFSLKERIVAFISEHENELATKS